VKGSKAARKKNIEVFFSSVPSVTPADRCGALPCAWIYAAPSKMTPHLGFFGRDLSGFSLLATAIGGLTPTRKNNFPSL
jgi:hypothetical protein